MPHLPEIATRCQDKTPLVPAVTGRCLARDFRARFFLRNSLIPDPGLTPFTSVAGRSRLWGKTEVEDAVIPVQEC